MAHNYVNLSKIQLTDNWPGQPTLNLGRPKDGWDNTEDNFTTTAVTDVPSYPLGTKITGYTDNSYCPGWFTMMYMQYDTFESGFVGADFSDKKNVCVHIDTTTTMNADTSNSKYYVVTNDVTATTSDATKGGGRIAIPCCTLAADGTSSYGNGYGAAYGWFWVGGVCPCKEVTFLDNSNGNFTGAQVECASMFAGGAFYTDISGSGVYLTDGDASSFTGLDSSYGVKAIHVAAGYCDESGT